MGHWNHVVNRFRQVATSSLTYFEQRILNPNPTRTLFGWSVDITPDGLWGIVGSYNGNQAVIYKKDTVTGIVSVFQTLLPTWTNPVSFGFDVAISDDGLVAVVSDQNFASYKGSIRVYRRANTTQTFSLDYGYTSSLAGTPQLGFSVDISSDGTVIAVGVVTDNTRATSSGSVYYFFYDGNNWSLASKSYIPTSEANAYYGYSVALSGKYNQIGGNEYAVAVGAILATSNGMTGVGKVYVGWIGNTGVASVPSIVELGGMGSSESFGFKVALSSNANILLVNSGSSSYNLVRVYQFNTTTRTYSQIQAIVETGAGPSDASVSPDGMYLAIGCGNDSTTYGKVMLYKYNGSTYDYVDSIFASDKQLSSYFGYGVKLSNSSNLIVGSYMDNSTGANAGEAYYYNFTV